LRKLVRAFVFLSVGTFLAVASIASGQSLVRDRITQQVNSASTVALPGSTNPLAKAQYDVGRANASTPMSGVTMYFQPSAEQQAALDALVQAQQTPGSPYYHQWITPAQYASQFGLSANDLAKVKAWLEQQGLAVERVSNSRNAISFTGTVAQIESAFQTEVHRYNINGVTHTANASAFVIPSALAGVVLSVGNVSDFRPHPLHKLRTAAQFNSNYNFSSGGATYHFLAPGDFATIYDLNPLYSAGYTGSGETIAIVGQSAIASTDVTHFQSASGLTQKAPTMTLVPNSGTSVADDSGGDEDESDLDVEWSGAVAKGATINFVYVGNNQSYSVFDSLQYAIDNDLAPVISISYGACEADLASSDITTFESWFTQANTQGQTIVASSGDNGATDCEVDSTPGKTVVNGDEATKGLAVDFPGSSPFITTIGGTTLNGDESSPGTYWNSSNSTSNSSAIQYIPETVWNDTSTSSGPEGSGGGKSILFGKPSWQTGTGVPSDGARDVPDVSLAASPDHDGYLFCASGTGGTDADPTSCSNGYLDSSGDPSVAGGTSFGAPSFAGILTILIQKLGVTGLGNINPEIYSLAATDYSSAFHDVTTGNNDVPCEVGTPDCTTSPIGYAATTGYDLATGWGSIDAANFAGVFTTGAVSTSGSESFTLSATGVTVAQGSSGSSTVTVGTPVDVTGSVALTATAPSTLTNACFTYTNPTATTTGTITIYTSSSACVSAAVKRFNVAGVSTTHDNRPSSFTPIRGIAGTVFLSLVFIGFPGLRRRRWPMLCAILSLASLTLVLSGCGSSGNSTSTSTKSTSTNAPQGTYTITVSGTNGTPSVSATTTFTLTVD
jgi:subtilase family serine protease